MAKFIIPVIFLLATVNTTGQSYMTSLSRKDVNDLQRTLKQNLEHTTRVNILLQLADYYLGKWGNETWNLDSAALYIDNAKLVNDKQLSWQRNGLILLYESTLTRKRGDTEAGKRLVKKAIELLQTSNDELGLAMAYLELSRCYDSEKPEESAIIKSVFNLLFQRVPKLIANQLVDSCMFEIMRFYNQNMTGDSYFIQLDFLDHVLGIYKTLNDKVNEFWVRKEIADIHYKQGKLDNAISELLAIVKEQKTGNYPGICFTYDLLSGLYYSAGKVDKALYYSLESIKNVTTELDSASLTNFYARVALCYSSSGSVAEAVNWNLKRVNYQIAVNKTDGIYGNIFRVISDLIKLGRNREALDLIINKSKSIVPADSVDKRNMLLGLTKCYDAVNNNTMAEKYCKELIDLYELQLKLKKESSVSAIDQFLASFFLARRQFSTAEKYFRRMVGENKQTVGATALYSNDFLFKLDSAQGNYLSSIKYLQIYYRIKDSIFTETKTKQIEELKIAYATEEKDSLIKLNEQNIRLLKKEDELQKSKLQQGAILRNISFAIVALLIIIMALLYNSYRLKQRTNIKLESHQREIAKQNNSLHHLLNEKEWLLKEIHHRVKNNLQIVMSLLNSQSAYIENDAALTAIHDSQHRVHAMSLIHQKLYNSENLSSIDMSFYIRELASYLSDSFGTGQRIRFDLNIQPLEMDVSQAVPLGLILNEAITNSIKYAFPDGRNGVISIALSNTGSNHYLLGISDNGIGMPAQFTNKKPGSLGMSLMAGLSEDLDGKFSIVNDNGTIIKILFIHDLNVKRPDISASAFVNSN